MLKRLIGYLAAMYTVMGIFWFSGGNFERTVSLGIALAIAIICGIFIDYMIGEQDGGNQTYKK